VQISQAALTKAGVGACQAASLSFTVFAGAKVSFRAALIVMVSPVAGLRPSRSGVSFTLNLPAGKRHVFALYRSFDDDGEEGVDKFAGVSLVTVLVGQPGREIDIGHVLFLLLGGKG
jgi:hypothetical protein